MKILGLVTKNLIKMSILNVFIINCIFYVASFVCSIVSLNAAEVDVKSEYNSLFIQRVHCLGIMQEVHNKLSAIERQASKNLNNNDFENNIATVAITCVKQDGSSNFLHKSSFFIGSKKVKGGDEVLDLVKVDNGTGKVVFFESGRDDKNKGVIKVDNRINAISQNSELKHINENHLIKWLEEILQYQGDQRKKLFRRMQTLLLPNAAVENAENILFTELNSIYDTLIKLKQINQDARGYNQSFGTQNTLKATHQLKIAKENQIKRLFVYLKSAKEKLEKYSIDRSNLEEMLRIYFYKKYWHSEQRIFYSLLINWNEINLLIEQYMNELLLDINNNKYIIINLHSRLGLCPNCTRTTFYFLKRLQSEIDKIPVSLTISYRRPFGKPKYSHNTLRNDPLCEENNKYNKVVLSTFPYQLDCLANELRDISIQLEQYKDINDVIKKVINSNIKVMSNHIANKQGVLDISFIDKSIVEGRSLLIEVVDNIRALQSNTKYIAKSKNKEIENFDEIVNKINNIIMHLINMQNIVKTICKEIPDILKNINYGKEDREIIQEPDISTFAIGCDAEKEKPIYVTQIFTEDEEMANTTDSRKTYWVDLPDMVD